MLRLSEITWQSRTALKVLLSTTRILFIQLALIIHACTETGTASESVHARSPVVVAPAAADGPTALIPDTMRIGDTVVAGVGGLFSDPDGESLTYAAESSAADVIQVASMRRDTVTLSAVGRGLATVTVRASDPGGQSASVAFRVTVIRQVAELTTGSRLHPFADATVGDRTVGTLQLGLNPHAFPVIIKESESWANVLVAGSYLGDGRVVAFSGQDFLSSGDRATILGHAGADRLLANAVRWAGSNSVAPLRTLVDNQRIADALEGQGLDGVEVVGRGPGWQEGDWNPAALADADVAVVQVNEWGTRRLVWNHVAPLRAFVERGGGLIVAGSALHWSWWIEGDHGPFTGNILLRGTGISWNEDSIAEIESASTDVDLRLLTPTSLWSAWLAGEQLDTTQTAFLPSLFGSVLDSGRRGELDEALARLARETPQLPTPSGSSKARLAAAIAETMGPHEWPEAHPWAAEFPGLPADWALPTDGTVTVDASWAEFPLDASRGERHFPLGFYAPPSAVTTIEVPADLADGALRVAVGELYDRLGDVRQGGALPVWRRAPNLRREFPVAELQTDVTNAYGGSIALIVPADFAGTIPVTVRGAIPMAVYTAGQSDPATWFAALEAGAPQAIIQKLGGIRFVISVESARKIIHPAEVLAFWDGFQRHHAELAGEPVPRAYESIWIFDPQVGHGLANASGHRISYPLHAELWALLPGMAGGREYIAELPSLGPQPHIYPPPIRGYSPWSHGVDWWLFGHELGHQWQTEDWGSGRTYPEIGEVAVNLFTMYTLNDYIFGGGEFTFISSHDRAMHPVDHAQLANLRWPVADVFDRLSMYRQLISEFGWTPIKRVFQSYYDPAYPRSIYGSELDGFAIRLSAILDRDLVGFFQSWEYPLSDTAISTIRSFSLEAWLPPGW